MKRRRARLVSVASVFAGILLGLGPSPALASEAPCVGPALQVDGAARARWPDLAERMRQELAALAGRAHVDACAEVELRWRDGALVAAVVLPDGRAASRSVLRQEDVLPVLEALLLVPAPPTQALSDTARPTVVTPPAPAPTTPPDRQVELAPAAAPPGADAKPQAPGVGGERRLGIELSIATGVRIGDGQTSAGLGALSFVDIDGWLAGFAGRVDRDQEIAGGDAGGGLIVAALGGRRIRFGTLALDIIGGPGLALRGSSTSRIRTNTEIKSSTSDLGTVPRALVAGHLTFGARSTFRSFIGVEGEFGAAYAPGSAAISPGERLPIWSVGIALGGTVGTR
jgi:hypothetical protein